MTKEAPKLDWRISPPGWPGTYWVCRGEKMFPVCLAYDEVLDTWSMSAPLLEITWRSGEYNLKSLLWWPEAINPPPLPSELVL